VTALVVLLALSVALMVCLSSVRSVAFDFSVYEYEFEKLNIYDRFDKDILHNETKFLINYLAAGDGEIDSNFFNTKEKIHLVEVKTLFRIADTLINIAAILSIACIIMIYIFVGMLYPRIATRNDYLKKIVSFLLVASGVTVIGTCLLFILMTLTFDFSFILFHKIAFRTDTWLLDPAVDNLIRMFPQQFFFDLFMRILYACIFFGAVFLGVGSLLKKSM